MKFVIYGTGGVGGFFGSKLARNGEDVWFIARGSHLTAMQKDGLRVHSTEGSWVIPGRTMTDDPRKVGVADVVLFCVKSYDTESAARRLDPLLSENTLVISLQNGIDNEEKIKRTISRGTVFGGLANIYSTITAPGVVTESGGPRTLTFGPLGSADPLTSDRAAATLKIMVDAGINANLSTDIESDLWRKFIFITGVGGLTALTRLTLGEILAVEETCLLLRDAMKETEAVARAAGIPIEFSFIGTVFDKLRKFDNSTRSSLYYDLAHRKPMEVDALAGTVVRLGRQYGVPTPVQQTIYFSLLPYHLMHSRTAPTETQEAAT